MNLITLIQVGISLGHEFFIFTCIRWKFDLLIAVRHFARSGMLHTSVHKKQYDMELYVIDTRVWKHVECQVEVFLNHNLEVVAIMTGETVTDQLTAQIL